MTIINLENQTFVVTGNTGKIIAVGRARRVESHLACILTSELDIV